MGGRSVSYVVDEFSRLCLAIRVGWRCKAIDVIDTIEDLLKQYPAPTHLRMDNGPEFIAMHCRNGAQAADPVRHTSRQAHPGRIHSWNHSTAGSGKNP